ncbi:helicase SNF2 [Luteimicrobium album]|uniref:Helicase SNF2 n=1 Tax=Luteimicrobium album TaxID=1054550 RepID=A0ABQ6I522_9MICO|nr:DEAD/DEAH box helicase [Luteimicrobium album]GMA25737.1 helicase SNF2 [Luteimicrobium album]
MPSASDASVIGPGVPVEPGREARDLIDRHARLAATAQGILDHLDGAVVAVAAWVHDDERRRAREELAHVDTDRLGEMTDRNLRLAAVQAAGYLTAADLIDVQPATLAAFPGVGETTARGVVAAVGQLSDAALALHPLRIGLDRAGLPTPDGADRLLALLHRIMRLRPLVEPHRTLLADYASTVTAALPAARRARHAARLWFARPTTRKATAGALASLQQWDASGVAGRLPQTLDDLTGAIAQPDPDVFELAADYEQRSAEYYTTLVGIVPQAQTALAARGLLPQDLVDRVNDRPLDLGAMRVALRGYQEFGARFALNQGRCLIGDEMGLGKTIQALAVMSDLVAAGQTRFLVVCPASLLANWAREVEARTTLTAHRLHGDGRDEAIKAWAAGGGVGLTTFETLTHVPTDGSVGEVGLVVVDEAHYVKNPRTRRAKAVATWAGLVWRVLFLTGTPMDNRLEDFLALVKVLQPDLGAQLPRHLGLLGPDAFRQVVAPVYLRRNQVDVLVELPDVIATDDWVDLTEADERAYREAVASGNLMAMRQAAWVAGSGGASACAKLDRLVAIVTEAREEGRSTVVFSYFRDVLDTVMAALAAPGVSVHGPLTGDVPVADRMALVDAFTADDAGAVLVAQVAVGGTGLNLQAASVVVLCEPQLTPAAEAQAVARLHRMGQVRTVRAHRLLAEDGVDERIVELLAGKQEVFDDYVRRSSVAAAAVSAVDVTEAGLARDVVAWEQARLGYGPVWDGLGDEEAGRPPRDCTRSR